MSKDQERLSDLIEAAKRAGADRADALMVASRSVSAMCRQGVPEGLEHSETLALGLRVFVGKRAASVSATALDPSRFEALAQQAVAMAHVVPEDAWAVQSIPTAGRVRYRGARYGRSDRSPEP